MSLDAMLELVHIWIVDIYHHEVHRGIRDIPYHRWNKAIAEWPPNLPAKDSDLDVLLGCIAQRR
ncbi:MAG: hypothetical protein ACREDR_15145, partial [Blastocatellia bacterium]